MALDPTLVTAAVGMAGIGGTLYASRMASSSAERRDLAQRVDSQRQALLPLLGEVKAWITSERWDDFPEAFTTAATPKAGVSIAQVVANLREVALLHHDSQVRAGARDLAGSIEGSVNLGDAIRGPHGAIDVDELKAWDRAVDELIEAVHRA